MTVTILRVSGIEETHELPRFRAIENICRLIGARTLDVVGLRDGRVMLVDDEGHVRADRPPVNPKATALYHGVCRPGTTHQIVGDVAIAIDEDFA